MTAQRASDSQDHAKVTRLAGLLIGLVSIVCSLVVVEIAVRVMAHGSPAQPITDRPQRYYVPEASRSNRDYAYSAERQANTYRIAVIGDSFTFGYNVMLDDTYSKRLERMLNLNLDQPRVEVLNLGKPGLSTRGEIPELKRALELFHPDLVLLQITLNDPELQSPRKRLAATIPDQGLYHYWKTLALVMQRVENSRSRSEYVTYFKSLFQPSEAFSSFQQALAQAADICKQAKTPLVAIVFPLLSFGFDTTYPFHDEHLLIKQELDKLSIPSIDLLSRLSGLQSIRLEAIPAADPHPNEIAHRIAAEELVTWFDRQSLVPTNVIPRISMRERLELKRFSSAGAGTQGEEDPSTPGA